MKTIPDPVRAGFDPAGNYANSLTSFAADFSTKGFLLLEDIFDGGLVSRLKSSLGIAVAKEQSIKVELNADANAHDPHQVVCCPYHDEIFLEVLRNREFIAMVDSLLGENCILFSYNNSSLEPGQGNFSSRPHVDRSYFTGDYLEGVGALLLLDDFTVENGATWFLPGSHNHPSNEPPAGFYESASRLVARAGSIFFFNPRLWHAAGINNSCSRRDALILAFARPHIKQHLDLVKLLAHRIPEKTEMNVLQKIGFFARPPESLEQYYAVDEMSRDLWRMKKDGK